MTMPAGWKPKEDDLLRGPEETIWSNTIMTGIINRKVAEVQRITNRRVFQNERIVNLVDLDDIIVMNQHRSSQGYGTRYYVRGFNASYGVGQSRGKTVGDVVFVVQGRPVIIFRGIDDPHGVCRLAKTARKSMINFLKIAQKNKETMGKESRQKSIKKRKYQVEMTENQNQYLSQQETRTNNVLCPKCQFKNELGASFCGMCGTSLSFNCSKCGNHNPPLSSFCNKCGFTLA